MSSTNPYEALAAIGHNPSPADLESVGITPTGNAATDMMMLDKAREHARKAQQRADLVSGTMTYRPVRDEQAAAEEVVPARPCPRCGVDGVHSHALFAEGWA